jgi:hypothetical protein
VPEYKFLITVNVPDDHDNADDMRWWWDAAHGDLRGYGATEVTVEAVLPYFKPARAVLDWDEDPTS